MRLFYFMGAKNDLTGQTFGRLIVIKEAERRKDGLIRWLCKCGCGNEAAVLSYLLRNGGTISCGCYHNERLISDNTTHGQSDKTSEYAIWTAMKSRCNNPNNKYYKHYGGRGIKVCERWAHSFENFFEDMGQRPSKQHSLDRYPNNDGNYELLNCRWATQKEQTRNTRQNHWIVYNGEKMVLKDWAVKLDTDSPKIIRMLKTGRTFEQIYNYYIYKIPLKRIKKTELYENVTQQDFSKT